MFQSWQENKPKPVRKKQLQWPVWNAASWPQIWGTEPLGASHKHKRTIHPLKSPLWQCCEWCRSSSWPWQSWLHSSTWGSCWRPGSLLPSSAKSPQFLHSFQIPPLVFPFPLILIIFTFTNPYNSVRGVCHFPCAHRHIIAPFFSYFHLTVFAPSLPSALNQYQQTYSMVRPQKTEEYKYSLLSSWVEAILTFLSKGVCICTHVRDQRHTHMPQVPLEYSLWTSHVSVKGLCHTLWVSLFVNVLYHLFYRITPSSISPLLFFPPMPFTGPKPAVEKLLLPFAHLEQNT